MTFGVVPQQSASRMAELWTPLLRYLEQVSGVRLVFATARDIPTFERRLAAGEYDFAYINPWHYALYRGVPGYRALARERDRHLQGLIVVPADSPARAPADLAGATLAFPGPAAFAASVLPQAHLRRQRITYTARYLVSHDSVYLAVAKGMYPAGGGVFGTLQQLDPQVRARLRVLWTTPPYPPHALAAHPHVSPAVLAKVREALLAMDREPAARPLLQALALNGFAPARDADWDDMRALKLDEFKDLLRGVGR